jgi:transposase
LEELKRYRRGEPITASTSSVQRWQHQRIIPFEMTGNHAHQKIHGYDLFLLMLFRLVYPKACADEIRCFVLKNSHHPCIYSRSDIYLTEKRLGFTRKVASTTAIQATSNETVRRTTIFWNSPPPAGVLNVNRYESIDSDETGIHLESCNRSSGKAFSGVCVNEIGFYSHSEKWTIIASIGADNFRNIFIHRAGGTTKEIFRNYIHSTLQLIPQGAPRRVFMWDNLRSHFDDELANMIYAQGHGIVPRPPYSPALGPIEYIFNDLETGLKRNLYKIRNQADLVACAREVFMSLRGFDNTFKHCGY